MRRTLDYVGLGGLIVIGVLIWRTNQYSAFPYRGGMLLLSIATGARHHGLRLPRQLARKNPGHAAHPLDRRPFVRDLPVALPGHRVDHRRACRAASTCRAPPCRPPSPSSWPPCRGGSSKNPSGRADASPPPMACRWHRRIAARWTWAVSTAALAGLALTAADHRGRWCRLPSNTLLTAGACPAQAPAVHEVVSKPARRPTPRRRPRPEAPTAVRRRPRSLANPGIPFTPIYPSRRRRRPGQHDTARVGDHLVVPVGRPHRRLHLREPHLF